MLLLVLYSARLALAAQSEPDAFGFFRPSVVSSEADRLRLDTGGTVARVGAGPHGVIAVFSAAALDADSDRSVNWMRHITLLTKNEYVQAIGRFSNPTQVSIPRGDGAVTRGAVAVGKQILERRLRSEAPAILQTLRQRLESGDPPE